MAGSGSAVREVSFVRKTADETVNNDNTPNNDSELLLPIVANEVVKVEMIFFWEANAAGGVTLSINGPAAPTNLRWGGYIIDGLGANVDSTRTNVYNATGLRMLSTNGTGTLYALVENGANAGNIYASWAQHTVDANNTTILRGSFMQMWRVA